LALLPITGRAQQDFRPVPNLPNIEYKLNTNLPSAAPQKGNPIPGTVTWYVYVTVKNTAAAAQKLMLCAYGQSDDLVKNQMVTLTPVTLSYNKAANQILCTLAAKTVEVKYRVGNLGCQLVTVPAMQTQTVTFLTGALSGGVQDGNFRKVNGRDPKAQQGGGHRDTSTIASFGKPPPPATNTGKGNMPIRAVLDLLNVQWYLFTDQTIDMACMAKDDPKAKVDLTLNPPDPVYTPNCAKPVPAAMACNQCYGMDRVPTPMQAGFPNGITTGTTSRAWSILTKLPPVGQGRMDIPLKTDAIVGHVDTGTCQASIAVTYAPPLSGPNPLSPCDPSTPGCFDVSPPAGQSSPFDVVPDTGEFVTLSINFPSSTLSNFAGDFFVTLTSQASSCGADPGQTLGEYWIPIRPQLMCDVNLDGQVDVDDITEIFAVIGSSVSIGSPYDPDGDGFVTIDDARLCTLRCTNTNCAR
jgi:hypothetical protein